jgi:PadR family transcriptional regulator, regulatory protein PadR
VDTDRELLKGNTPALVLAVLAAEGPLHTYAIGRVIRERTGAVLDFKRGTLYPVLHALERDGLVSGDWEFGGEAGGDRPRRVYAITDAGRQALEERTATWQRFSRAVNQVLPESAGTGEKRERTA